MRCGETYSRPLGKCVEVGTVCLVPRWAISSRLWRAADRETLSFSECASIARSAADVIRYLQAEPDQR